MSTYRQGLECIDHCCTCTYTSHTCSNRENTNFYEFFEFLIFIVFLHISQGLEREMAVCRSRLSGEEERRGRMVEAYETQVSTVCVVCVCFNVYRYIDG